MRYFVFVDSNRNIVGMSSQIGRSIPTNRDLTVHEISETKFNEIDNFQADDGDGRGLTRQQLQYRDAISEVGPRFKWDNTLGDFTVNPFPTVPTRPPPPGTEETP